ncbi:ABC transporter substrate-binding protein [Leucobacter triazinivorans]|uniref:ABC transporter substrate-binding protein n=1 Tax=Leucobacter triazinivorans TaxID=1784719 RepID=UPI0013EE8C4D|nr:ABC transporter substrate-binding protein [Leucobacter triazinivorans]
MNHRFRYVFAAAGTAAALALTGCGGGGDGPEAGEQTSEVRVALIANANNLPLLVADANGYFVDEGLEVTLEPVQNLGALAGAMGKQYDLGSSTIADVILQQQQGLDLVIATGVAEESADNPTVGVLVPGDSPIESVEDLEGKTIAAATLGGNLHPSVVNWLIGGGVSADSVTITEIPFPNMADQLANGRVDAVESLEPFRGQLLASGARELVNPLTRISDPVAFVSLMATGEFVENNPDALAKFTSALERAAEFIAEDEVAARAVLSDSTQLPEEVVKSVTLPTYTTSIDPDEVALWAKVLEENGQLQGSASDVDPAKIYPAGKQG